MSQLRCPNCNNNQSDSLLKTADGRLVCALCGAVVSMPKNEQSDQHSRIVYGYEHIRAFEFKNAMEAFEGVIKDYPDSVDGYWGYLQAYYGIVYVKGYGENLPKPTFCYAVEQEKIEINKHPHYQKILELVKDSKQKTIFEQRMKVLTADFQFVKRQVNLKEKYDVFICAKISPLPTTKTVLMDHDEKRTMDWQVATELYNQLTAPASGKEKPLKVFFSDRSIDGGIEYDKQIWSAMLRSRHILVVGTDKAHLESTWVKSEWRRWLYLIEKDKSRGKDTFIAYIPDRKNWPYVKPDVWDHYRVQITHTEDDMDKLISKLRRNGSVVADNSAPEFDMRDVEKIRALIAYGNYDSAHALLDPLFREHPEVGEFALLSMRLNTNNFTDMSSVSESQLEYAGKHLMLTAKATDNVEYVDAKKAMKSKGNNKKSVDHASRLVKEKSSHSKNTNKVPTKTKHNIPWARIIVIALVLIAIGSIIGLSIYSWKVGQWIIGIILGIAIIAMTVIPYLANYAYFPQIWIIVGITIVNIILAWLLPESYSTMALPISLGAAASLFICAYYAYDDREEVIGSFAVLMMACNLAVATSVKGGFSSLLLWLFVYLGPAILIAGIITAVFEFCDVDNGILISSITAIVIIGLHVLLACLCPHFLHSLHKYPQLLDKEFGHKKAICYCEEEIEVSQFIGEFIHGYTCEQYNLWKPFESSTYKFDEQHHWLECSCGTVTGACLFEHEFDNNVCRVCGYDKENQIVPDEQAALYKKADQYLANENICAAAVAFARCGGYKGTSLRCVDTSYRE